MELKNPIAAHFRILPMQEKALKRLGIITVEDLLYHFPARYGDTAQVTSIANLHKGESAVIFGRISGLKTSKAFRKKIPMAEAVVEDDTGKIKIIWFHQAYLAKMIAEGANVRVEGKVSERSVRQAQDKQGELYFSNPKIENAPDLFTQDKSHSLYPVYPETRGITSNWIYHKIQNLMSRGILDTIVDPIPENILKTYKLPNLKTSLVWIHAPRKAEHAQAARKRLSFEEIFFIQLERQRRRHEFKEHSAFVIDKGEAEIEKFVARFPFAITAAQRKSIEQILADFKKSHPMSRLLEGDVGSGKTAVAAAAVYAVVASKLQVAYMAPTEILARQHFESFIKFFWKQGVQIALITGSGCLKFPSKVNPESYTNISRTQLLKWVANGEISVVIGTHALIQKSVKFKHLALVIVDEQHRFGTAQRQKLVNKHEVVPHLLSMTATPIPRTLALTLYGDLDLSLLDEMPAGRKKIITEIITPAERARAYEKIRGELEAGRQLYVICPRIDEPDPTNELAVQAKSVKEEAKRLKKEVFPEYEIEILHSKMKPAEKERVMLDFRDKKIDILVATSVVEVGVNVENASLIVIEGAERFGLAQLHQLRGRVLRGTHQPYCFVFTDSNSRAATARLDALRRAKDGFELAEFDLAQRGAGQLAGAKQWGISDIGMEAIKNIKMVEAARLEATRLIESDPTLAKFPLLKARLNSPAPQIHFE
ncbi:MAG: ATP-dependent DNA helicase RecG [bacterium]|nr:ATP-dependent DNA helicase RecG [bacterium]